MHTISVFDHNTHKRIAFLQNAYHIGYTQEHNALWSATFTMPISDPKNQYPYCQGSAYYNGTWAIACCGYDSNTSRTVYKPVVYVANDINGAWTPVTLSDGNYYLSGILYSQRFESWIAYGYKYVSDTECYTP